MTNIYSLDAYDYDLPTELIAQAPSNPPDTCKLLIFDKKNNSIIDEVFYNIINYLNGNEVLFFNNTKVLKARLLLKKVDINNIGQKNIKNNIYAVEFTKNPKEADFEIFFLNKIGENSFNALVRPGKKFKIGTIFKKVNSDINFIVKEYSNNGRIISIEGDDLENILEKYGLMPLPPYIEYDITKEKNYQHIFAEKPGSVAAPTASLHFTKNLLEKLRKKGIKFEYVTLHIGLGTFKKIDTKDITKYDIHSENIEINLDIFEKIAKYKSNNNIIVAVGTTVTRTLESLPYLWKKIITNNLLNTNVLFDRYTIDFWNKISDNIVKNDNKEIVSEISIKENSLKFKTKLYIYPGFKFLIIDQLITNFHLPKSSLLTLVVAFMGYENMMKVYDHAIKNKYKFFSFGDAMRIK